MFDSLQEFVEVAVGLGDLRNPSVWCFLDGLSPQKNYKGKVRGPGCL